MAAGIARAASIKSIGNLYSDVSHSSVERSLLGTIEFNMPVSHPVPVRASVGGAQPRGISSSIPSTHTRITRSQAGSQRSLVLARPV